MGQLQVSGPWLWTLALLLTVHMIIGKLLSLPKPPFPQDKMQTPPLSWGGHKRLALKVFSTNPEYFPHGSRPITHSLQEHSNDGMSETGLKQIQDTAINGRVTVKGEVGEHLYYLHPLCPTLSSTNLPSFLPAFRCYQILNQLGNFGIQKPGNQNDWIHRGNLYQASAKTWAQLLKRNPGYASPPEETVGSPGKERLGMNSLIWGKCAQAQSTKHRTPSWRKVVGRLGDGSGSGEGEVGQEWHSSSDPDLRLSEKWEQKYFSRLCSRQIGVAREMAVWGTFSSRCNLSELLSS